MSNTEISIMYSIILVLSMGVAASVYVSCWPSTTPEGRSEFLHVFGEFWKDDEGNYPIFIASHLVNLFSNITSFRRLISHVKIGLGPYSHLWVKDVNPG